MFRRFITIFAACGVSTLPFYAHADAGQPVIAPWQPDKPLYIEESEPVQPMLLRQKHLQTTQGEIKIPSPLEVMYADRTVENLRQYGYDMLEQAPEESIVSKNRIPAGGVPDDFILSHQDGVEVVFSGQRTDRGVYKINSEGVLLIRDFPPVPAAGRTIGQVREAVQAAIDSRYNINAHVSLASVRQIDVLIVGHARRPGRKTLTVFHTVLDAIIEAGGIGKTGSLRRIKLVRDGRGTFIDLYDLFMLGSVNIDLKLRDGDRIIIPPVGPTVAIAGEVKRPGIYEILPQSSAIPSGPFTSSEKLSLNSMLELGGGVLAPGDNRFLKLGITGQGQEIVQEIDDPFLPEFNDGSVLLVSKGDAKRYGTVEIFGHTRKPGIHALGKNATLSQLFDSEDVLDSDIYPLMGVIERWDTEKLTPVIVDFPLRLVLKGSFDQELQDGDKITLFSNSQIRTLQSHDDTEFQNTDFKPEDSQQGALPPALSNYLAERSVFVRGAVRYPGAYPVSDGATLDMALAVAGGVTLEANTGNVEVTTALNKEADPQTIDSPQRLAVNFRETNPQEIAIEAGDSVRVNQKFKKIADSSVLVMGEVKNPGRYDLMPGDTVFSLLERAGGLTDQAYPDGAVFSRASERKAEESRFRAQARFLRQAVAGALQVHEDEKSPQVNAAQISEARALAGELEQIEGVGRITVEADPLVLKNKPELDMLLESGDRLFIPQRSLTVRVSGEILSPAALQFKEGKKPLDYIHEAGGFSFHADQDRAFVLYPDGSAQPLQVSSWNIIRSLSRPALPSLCRAIQSRLILSRVSKMCHKS